MKLYRFDKEVGMHITHFDSNFIMSRVVKTDSPTHIGCMHLEANGIVGFHEAVVHQLLLVVGGEGWVRADDHPKVKLRAGDAVFWQKGEGHETTTTTGLTAIVIESEYLEPSKLMLVKEIN